MDIFNILEMVGGLCLFLFGMSVMGQALEKSAGGKLRSLLSKMTSTKMTGFLTGLRSVYKELHADRETGC